jgi:integrase
LWKIGQGRERSLLHRRSRVPWRVLELIAASRRVRAWFTVPLLCKAAGARYRPHDMRHTFISRLAENPNVSAQTIKALAGHVSRQMLERYSHIRSQAKQAAIQALEHDAIEPNLQATGTESGTVT